jgi:predicted dehydrogenase
MHKTISIGIVGTGGMAHAHDDNFKKQPGVELVSCLGVVPGRAEAFAQKFGIQSAAGSLDELLGRVDAVSVVTPDRFHVEPSLAALKAGKHLLCEKPLAVTLADARKVAKAAKRARVIHMVNFSYRSSSAFQKGIEIVRAGQLGALRHVHSFYLQSWVSTNVWGGWANEGKLWRLQTAAGSGGVLGDIGCHILDLTTAVAGDVKRVRCDLRTFPKVDPTGKTVTRWHGQTLDANDTAIIELEFADGAVGIVHTTRCATGHKNHLRLEVHGTEGALMFDLDRDYHQIDLCLGADRHDAKWTTEKLKPTPNVYERFITAIRTGQPDQPDIVRGAQVQAYLDACERSAKSGKWESVRAWK